MAKQLTLDEMIESLTLMNHPAAGACQAVIEAIGTLMADTIAAALGVTAGPATLRALPLPAHARLSAPHFPASPAPARFRITILKSGMTNLIHPLRPVQNHPRSEAIRSKRRSVDHSINIGSMKRRHRGRMPPGTPG